jgi:hypothetical protein
MLAVGYLFWHFPATSDHEHVHVKPFVLPERLAFSASSVVQGLEQLDETSHLK